MQFLVWAILSLALNWSAVNSQLFNFMNNNNAPTTLRVLPDLWDHLDDVAAFGASDVVESIIDPRQMDRRPWTPLKKGLTPQKRSDNLGQSGNDGYGAPAPSPSQPAPAPSMGYDLPQIDPRLAPPPVPVFVAPPSTPQLPPAPAPVFAPGPSYMSNQIPSDSQSQVNYSMLKPSESNLTKSNSILIVA